jgi:hypothetical protein
MCRVNFCASAYYFLDENDGLAVISQLHRENHIPAERRA